MNAETTGNKKTRMLNTRTVFSRHQNALTLSVAEFGTFLANLVSQHSPILRTSKPRQSAGKIHGFYLLVSATEVLRCDHEMCHQVKRYKHRRYQREWQMLHRLRSCASVDH